MENSTPGRPERINGSGPFHKIIPVMVTALIMAFIFFQSALPADVSSKESGLIVVRLAALLGADEELISFVVRKCAHFAEYMLLGACWLWTICVHRKARGFSDSRRPWHISVLPAWLIGTAYAVSDEVHQLFVPGRSCEIRDILIDSCGVAAGIAVYLVISARRRAHSITRT